MLLNKIKRMFTGGEWRIAYKRKGSQSFKVISVPKGMWAADPMLFEFNGEHYLFAEIYENTKKKAGIGYFVFENGIPIFKGLIIDNDYHMSYPCVFEYNKNVYMIPESSANNSLDLYMAISFPNKWKKVSSVLTGCDLVDTTVFVKDDKVYLLSYTKNKNCWELILYSLDINNSFLKEESRLSYAKNIGRPAGYLLEKNKYYLRPAQDSSVKYGERILFFKIKSFSPLQEELVDKIDVTYLTLPSRAKRTHTYSEDSLYVVVDFFVEKFELFHAIEIYKRSHYRKSKK